MRINPYFGSQQTPATGRDKQTSPANSSSARLEPEADQAQLSGAHIQVQALAAQASQLPEVREAKINALRQAVESGQYRSDPANTAHSLMSEMFLSRTAWVAVTRVAGGSSRNSKGMTHARQRKPDGTCGVGSPGVGWTGRSGCLLAGLP